MLNNGTQWVNKLLKTFIQSSEIRLFFEEKEKLLDSKECINLSIHPIRFADDIFFNFQTNNEKIKHKLKKYEVNYEIFYHYADIVKASYLKNIKKNSIKKNSLLLIGQTEKDKVIFDGKRYLSLIDFIPQIRELALVYDNIYFKPHPYAKNSKFIYKNLQKELQNIEIIDENIYHLLSNDNILHVSALNSSVLYEAKYFRKEVSFLYRPTFDFENADIGIYRDYFDSSFWSDILDIKDTCIKLPFVASRLRKALNDFWGYNEISDEIIVKDIVKSKIKKYWLSLSDALTF